MANQNIKEYQIHKHNFKYEIIKGFIYQDKNGNSGNSRIDCQKVVILYHRFEFGSEHNLQKLRHRFIKCFDVVIEYFKIF